MGFFDFLGGKPGSGELDNALRTIQAVQGPTAEQLTLPELEQYVRQGLLTPQQYQAMLADPEIYSKVISNTQDTSGTDAQKAALQQLGGVVQAGGSTDINKANLLNNVNQTNQAMQAARQGIMQNAQERNALGGGMDVINQLMNEQSNAQNANLGAVNAASNNAQLALNAMTQQGQLGGQLQGQANQMSQAQAEAARQIAEYNSQLQSQANQYNTQTANQAQAANLQNAQDISNQNVQNANYRTQYNAQVPQTVYNNAMQKANAMAGVYGQQANQAQQQAQNNAGFFGGLLGTGAKLGAAYMTGGASLAPEAMDTTSNGYLQNSANQRKATLGYAQGGEVEGMCHGGTCYAVGGEVHDHSLCMKAGGGVPGEEEVPGDDETNDTVPAMLSPHEIVLPKSVAQAPDAPQQAAQFVQQTKGMTPTVGSFQEVLKILEANGIELRLANSQNS
jgi:hypothetical protein